MRVVIIGGVACGAKTAARLARVCPTAEITLLERGADLSYANCGLPFFVGGEVAQATGLTHMGFGAERNALYFENYARTRAYTGHEVIEINREKKEVTVKVHPSDELTHFSYDTLVIATGASPIVPALSKNESDALKNVFTLWTLQDALAMRSALDTGSIRNVTIVGAGLVGVETAEVLHKKGLNVTLIDALPYPLMNIAGEDGGAMLAHLLKKQGVVFYGSERVLELEGKERVELVKTDQRHIATDMVLFSVGVRPNLDLAQRAGLEMGTVALRVDEQMRTSDPNIYAGGDCVECRCLITGEHRWQPMGSVANRHGRVIADNIAGIPSRFLGVEGSTIARVFNWTVATTGISFEKATSSGFSPEQISITAPDRPGFMQGSAPLFISLVVNKNSKQVLGSRIMGPGNVEKRIDVVATAIKGKLTIDDLAETDTAYAPPFSTALDPIAHAANALRNKCDGLMRSYNIQEIHAKAQREEPFTVLDVRTQQEITQMGSLPYESIHIPLGELNARVQELPRDRSLFILCKVGARAWTAFTMLKHAGFSNIAVIEGGFLAYSSM